MSHSTDFPMRRLSAMPNDPDFPRLATRHKKGGGKVCRRRGSNPRVYFDSVLALRPYTTRPHRRYTNELQTQVPRLPNHFPYAPTIRNAERHRFPSTGYKARKGESMSAAGFEPAGVF